ncbi:hypothetical protein BJ987_000631 [Nocardia goodfellowii]|uniref:Uncharacterized protein n=1 Tax=Nocardia goodfellowii TaxID=882446 RepID=A0ABS4Q9A2_9NOCA|nr:hypothetical protein [Nocardia goodfellowii]
MNSAVISRSRTAAHTLAAASNPATPAHAPVIPANTRTHRYQGGRV